MRNQSLRIAKAFAEIKRENFLPDSEKSLALLDQALPIGFGQTISQPTTVRMMLEWLDPQPGERVLDVGSGSGWTSALLAYLVGYTGKVVAVERVPELLEFGKQNMERLGSVNVEFHLAEKKVGWEKGAPYDRILVSASADKVPPELLMQLKSGGKLIIPVKSDVYEIMRPTQGENFTVQTHFSFVFVPLIQE